jgi:hypothetical protein
VFPTTKILAWVLIALSLCSMQLRAENSATASHFLGCYEVVSAHANSPKLSTSSVPHKFELTNQPTIFRDGSFQLSAATAATGPARLHHLWRPRGSRLTVEFGWGLGGWAGTLKPSGANEFQGKLQYFCDTLWCGKQSIAIRIRRVECEQLNVALSDAPAKAGPARRRRFEVEHAKRTTKSST